MKARPSKYANLRDTIGYYLKQTRKISYHMYRSKKMFTFNSLQTGAWIHVMCHNDSNPEITRAGGW